MKLTDTLRFFIFSLCLGYMLSTHATAQTSASPTYKYVVKAGDTFYTIARKHHTSTATLQKLNPGIDPEHIQADRVINVPNEQKGMEPTTTAKSAPTRPTTNTRSQQEPQQTSYLSYKVKRKDTLYSLALKHNVTIEQIIKANPQISDNGNKLKKGMVIRIPVIKEKIKTEPQYQGLSTIKVAVFLPLIGNGVEHHRSVEFYRGMLIGIDKLKENNINVHVTAYNEPANEVDATSIINEIKSEAPDVIVGPLYPGHFANAAAASSFNSKVVIPFSSKVPQVHTLPNLFVINTPAEYENTLISDLFVKSFTKQTNVIILHSLHGDKRTLCDELQKKLNAKNYNVSTAAASSSVETLKALMQAKTQGKFIYVCDDTSEATLKNILPKLATLRQTYPTAQISLLGFEQWIPFTEGALKNEIHAADTYILTPNYYYPYTAASIDFFQTYKQWFKADLLNCRPLMAPLGYDFSISFLGSMATFGHKYSTQSPQPGSVADTPNLQTNLRFSSVGNGGGNINRSMWLVHFKKDLSIVKNVNN